MKIVKIVLKISEVSNIAIKMKKFQKLQFKFFDFNLYLRTAHFKFT